MKKMTRQSSRLNDQGHEAHRSSFPYVKGEGCGNTFLIFDCLDWSGEQIEEMKHEAHALLIKEQRDDALILKKEYETSEEFVLTMIVLEPDQSIAEFCGNGARVVACYLRHKFHSTKKTFYLKTLHGRREIWWDDNDLFHVCMGKTRLGRMRHTNKFYHANPESFKLGLGMKEYSFYWTETLEPHLVTFDVINDDELNHLGLYLNHQQRDFFPHGINLNRAEIVSEGDLRVTTFERGVNRITAACGTGATSCAILAMALGRISKGRSVRISLKGGSMIIHPKKGGAVMSGPAELEFTR